MKRIVLVAVVMFSINAVFGPVQESSGGRIRSGPCTGSHGYVTAEMSPAVQQQNVRWLIACAVLQWPVPGGMGYAMSIAERESGLRPFAKNPGSSASGVYQFIDDTWDNMIEAWPVMNDWTGTWVFSARANVLRAIRTAHERGWGPWSL